MIMNAIRQMTYLENWLNHNVWDGEDRSGCKNDRANFNPDDLLELFTNFHEDLRLELNRAQSELKRSKEISKRQGEITAINMEDFIELTDELNEANAAIKCMNEIGVEPYDSKEQSQLKKHQKAIDRALKES